MGQWEDRTIKNHIVPISHSQKIEQQHSAATPLTETTAGITLQSDSGGGDGVACLSQTLKALCNFH